MPVLINCQLMYCNKVILSQGKCQYSSIFRLLVRLNVNLIVGYKIGYSFFTGLFCSLFLFALILFFFLPMRLLHLLSLQICCLPF
jgi:hypothetical protein